MQPPGRALSKKTPVSTAKTGSDGAAAGRAPGGAVVSVGPPLAGVEVHIRGHGGHWSGDSEVGEIWARGSSVCHGFLTSQGRVEATDSHGWLHTGDLGFLRGGELYVTGRQKDLIIIGGRNLYPQEIEAAIGELPGMRSGRVAAFGVEEAARGTEGLIVVAETIAPSLGDPASTAGTLRQEIFRRFGIAPHDIMLVGRGQLPLTTSGKLRRFEARSAYEQGAYSDVVFHLAAAARADGGGPRRTAPKASGMAPARASDPNRQSATPPGELPAPRCAGSLNAVTPGDPSSTVRHREQPPAAEGS